MKLKLRTKKKVTHSPGRGSQAATGSPTSTSPATVIAAARQRNLDRVQMEFTRLMHAVDDMKKYGNSDALNITGDILRTSYEILDHTIAFVRDQKEKELSRGPRSQAGTSPARDSIQRPARR